MFSIAEEQKEIDRQIDNFEATHIFSQEKNAEGKKAHDESVKILKELITPNTHGKVETIGNYDRLSSNFLHQLCYTLL